MPKGRPSSAPTSKADPAAVKQVVSEAESRIQGEATTPDGVQAAPADMIKKFGKFLPVIAKPIMEVVMIGTSGPLSPLKLTQIAGIVAEAMNAAMKLASEPESSPQPSAPPS